MVDDESSFEFLKDIGQRTDIESGAVLRFGDMLWEFFAPEDVRGFIRENQTNIEDSSDTSIFRTRVIKKPKKLRLNDSSVV